MNAKKFLRLTMLLLSLNLSTNSFAASDECGCQTSSINVGTGIHPSTGTPLSPGAFEPSWVCTQSPDPAIGTPAIPYVIPNGAGVWGSGTPALKTSLIAAASYISPFNTQTYMVNNPAPNPAFLFRLDFCVCTQNQYRITGLFNADDYAELWLDGTTHIQTCNGWVNVVNVNSTFTLSAGMHYLEIRLRNTGAQAMGVALSGNITSTNGASSLIGYDCCNARGGINGRKYLDENCNGEIDQTDPIGAGWTFNVNPGGYTVNSDALGYFNFPALPPGTYTLSEVTQPGWNPVLPNTSGSVTVNVVAGQITTVDFLNSNCDRNCDLECYWRTTGNNTINPSINYLGTNTNADLVIKTNNTERARIEGNGDGNMGIATTAPTTILHTYAAPPPSGAPSGLRFEDLPWGNGYILVADDDGYVYRTDIKPGKTLNSSMELLQMQQQVDNLKKEISSLKTMLQGRPGNNLTLSPNPTSGQLTATFQINQSYKSASINIVDNTGKLIMSNPIFGNEGTSDFVLPATMSSGDLIATLIVDGQVLATQKVVLLRK